MIHGIYNRLPKRVKAILMQEIRLEALKGSNVFCPCCNTGYITFLPFGLKKRMNALCPRCQSLERHRLMWLYFYNKTNIFRDQIRLLHIAPEQIFFERFRKASNIEYVPGAKLEPGFPDEYPQGTFNMDITGLPFKDNHFDAIYCSHVLEHVPDDKKAMEELYRVLKKNGFAILQVPLDKKREDTYEDFSIIDPGERERLFGQKDHVRVYGRDYKGRLENAGFNVKIDNYAGSFSEKDRNRYGLMKDEDIYYCTK